MRRFRCLYQAPDRTVIKGGSGCDGQPHRMIVAQPSESGEGIWIAGDPGRVLRQHDICLSCLHPIAESVEALTAGRSAGTAVAVVHEDVDDKPTLCGRMVKASPALPCNSLVILSG